MKISNFEDWINQGNGSVGDNISSQALQGPLWFEVIVNEVSLICFVFFSFKSVFTPTVKQRQMLIFAVQGVLTDCKGQLRQTTTKTQIICWKFPGYSICFKWMSYSFHLRADWMFINVLFIDLVLI